LNPPGSCPGALQEVLVLSGRRCVAGHGDRTLDVAQHQRSHSSHEFDLDQAVATRHHLDDPKAGWTRYLLSQSATAALEQFRSLPAVAALNAVARFEAATVTGANGFFCMTKATVEQNDLGEFVRPLLSRIRHSPGLMLTPEDQSHSAESGV